MKKYYKDEQGALYELTDDQVRDVERKLSIRLTEMEYKEWREQLIRFGGL